VSYTVNCIPQAGLWAFRAQPGMIPNGQNWTIVDQDRTTESSSLSGASPAMSCAISRALQHPISPPPHLASRRIPAPAALSNYVHVHAETRPIAPGAARIGGMAGVSLPS
jgi:hypothetical protein